MQRYRCVAAALLGALLGCAGCMAAGGSGVGFDPAGSAWLAEEIGGAVALERVQSTLVFEEEGGGVHGSGGCNRFQGTVSRRSAFMTFGPLATTRKACPGAVMDQESRFLRALEATRIFERQGPLLVLLAEDGSPLVRLAPFAP